MVDVEGTVSDKIQLVAKVKYVLNLLFDSLVYLV